MKKQETTHIGTQRASVPRGFRTNELYYIEEDTQRRIHLLTAQKQAGVTKSRQPQVTPVPQIRGEALLRGRLQSSKKKPAPNSSPAVHITVCDAARTPPLPPELIKDAKVAAYLKYFSTYGVCPLGQALNQYGIAHAGLASMPSARNAGSGGSPRSKEAERRPQSRDSSTTTLSRPSAGRLRTPRAPETDNPEVVRSFPSFIHRRELSAAPSARSWPPVARKADAYHDAVGWQRRSRTSTISSSLQNPAVNIQARRHRGWMPQNTGTGNTEGASSISRQPPSDVSLAVAGVAVAVLVPPLPLGSSVSGSTRPEFSGSMSGVLPQKDPCGGGIPVRKIKGSELMKNASAVEKQICETTNRKMGLLQDLTLKTAAFKQTTKRLGQRKATEAKLKQVEKVLEEAFTEVEKPLLAPPEFPEFFVPSESPHGGLAGEDGSRSGAAVACGLHSHAEKPPRSERDQRLREQPTGSAPCVMPNEGGMRAAKMRYVVVVDLASDTAVYLPDIREELTKFMQETMLKQHAVINIIKMGNKVDACFVTMPSRVDARTVTATYKFISGLTKSKQSEGCTDLVEGLRKALLMRPDVLYLIAHTPPSAVSHQKTCITMVREYFQAAGTRIFERNCTLKRPSKSFFGLITRNSSALRALVKCQAAMNTPVKMQANQIQDTSRRGKNQTNNTKDSGKGNLKKARDGGAKKSRAQPNPGKPRQKKKVKEPVA
ncbi:hypothetical protein BESB_082350 [Besnoitia besnoiti]|uniref:Uncharacterized protein n=1 Tax=Besnoitia besnoiti TaxID=94643 RepID=A0A2A9MAS6_BESBE|nr:hypothetical protein BESB_082350 [Besnoitia besnoiti]PFH33036.1 hypothetical protein BESB_082350 [Besnoitia besnoiti]